MPWALCGGGACPDGCRLGRSESSNRHSLFPSATIVHCPADRRRMGICWNYWSLWILYCGTTQKKPRSWRPRQGLQAGKPAARAQTLQPIIRKEVRLIILFMRANFAAAMLWMCPISSTIESIHSKLLADKHNHIKSHRKLLESSKRPLRKYDGIPKMYYRLFLNEWEWRFNLGSQADQSCLSQPLIIFFGKWFLAKNSLNFLGNVTG